MQVMIYIAITGCESSLIAGWLAVYMVLLVCVNALSLFPIETGV